MYVGKDTAVVVDATAPAVVVVGACEAVVDVDGAIVVDDAATVVVAEALVDAAEVVPLADTCKQHASNIHISPSQHALSPDALRRVSQHE